MLIAALSVGALCVSLLTMAWQINDLRARLDRASLLAEAQRVEFGLERLALLTRLDALREPPVGPTRLPLEVGPDTSEAGELAAHEEQRLRALLAENGVAL